MKIENRIKELRYIPASELRANPKNWRKHPTHQQKMLRTMFNEVGYIDALIGREGDDGSVELIDGHLRKEMSGHQDVPVLVLDVTEAEADLILASFDPITGMADTDKAILNDLLQSIETDDADIIELIGSISETDEDVIPEDISESVETAYQIMVICTDEADQESTFNRINKMGMNCRILTL